MVAAEGEESKEVDQDRPINRLRAGHGFGEGHPTLAAPASLRYALGVIPVTRRNVVVK